MFQIGNYLVSQDTIDLIPESVARECLVLPLRMTERTIEVLMASPAEAAGDVIQKLEFILNREIIARFTDVKTIRKGINLAFPATPRPSAPASPSQPPGRSGLG